MEPNTNFLASWRRFDLDFTLGPYDIEDAKGTSHLPFWILPTSVAIQFHASNLNRWLLLAESLINQAVPAKGHLRPFADNLRQTSNSVLFQACMKVIRIQMNSSTPEDVPSPCCSTARDSWA